MIAPLIAFLAADIAGTYNLKNMREAGAELVLKANGTFEFEFAYGAADYWGKGTWKEANGAVILSSYPAPKKDAFRLVKSSATPAAAVEVHVVSPGANPRAVPNIGVVLVTAAGNEEGQTDSDGVARFRKTSGIRGVIFDISVFEFRSPLAQVNAAHNEFTFEINGEVINEARFDAEPLKLDSAGLHMRGGRFSTSQETLYVKAH